MPSNLKPFILLLGSRKMLVSRTFCCPSTIIGVVFKRYCNTGTARIASLEVRMHAPFGRVLRITNLRPWARCFTGIWLFFDEVYERHGESPLTSNDSLSGGVAAPFRKHVSKS